MMKNIIFIPFAFKNGYKGGGKYKHSNVAI